MASYEKQSFLYGIATGMATNGGIGGSTTGESTNRTITANASMITNKQSYLTGYMVGCRLREGRPEGVVPEPIAYLYNGVQLPPLPEYDATEYPYSLIYYTPSHDFYAVYCFTVEPAVSSNANHTITKYDSSQSGKTISTVFGEGETNKFGDPLTFSALTASVADNLVWTNFDLRIKGTDDVYFAASEPIPVYE